MLWLFLPFVVILSGVVAYAADTIAKKAGRKHLRWFGLRPKTTALIVAVLSGMGISAASLAAFLVLNSSAINTIAQADQLRPQLEALRTEIVGVQADLKTAQSGRDTAQREADALREQQQAALSDLQTARSNLKDARTAQQRLQGEADALQDKVQALTTLREGLEARAARSRHAAHGVRSRAELQSGARADPGQSGRGPEYPLGAGRAGSPVGPEPCCRRPGSDRAGTGRG